ncbi:MAG: hypothetical protein MSG64_16200 [Pyrinomonadaceae bacterium MAG19_C2-C3]|nr:hypothetical protein [Pyrinomonadaceae bacterium MAG19_C2-C3]
MFSPHAGILLPENFKMDEAQSEVRIDKQLVERFSVVKRLSAIIVVLFFALTMLPPSINAQRSAARFDVTKRKPALQYYPPKGDAWQRKSPAEVGMNSAKLNEAVEFAKTRESRVPRDFSTQEQTFGKPLSSPSGAIHGRLTRPTAWRRVFSRLCWD